MWDVLAGLAGSLLIAGVAYKRQSLSASGAAAAVVVGTLMYALGSLPWFGVLIAFFISSSLLSKVKHQRKASAESQYEKTGTRDAGQVLANGGIATLCCVLHAIAPHPAWWLSFLGAMAAVTADTWATELGGLSRRSPVSIITGRKVPAGTSGGVTLLGCGASLAGAGYIAITAIVLSWISSGDYSLLYGSIAPLHLLFVVIASGFVGAMVDSFIGALWQRMYKCEICGRETERKMHCNEPCTIARGFKWMNNDAVNLLCSLTGAAWAAFLYA